MPLVWHERSFAAVVAGVSIKHQQVLESMPSYEKKEVEFNISLESEVEDICESEDFPLDQDELEDLIAEDEITLDDGEYENAEEEQDAEEEYVEYYEQYENQFAARLTETPRKPRSRISTITQRTISSNLRILSSACDTRSVCKAQLNWRSTKSKPPKAPKPPVCPVTGNFKVKSPYVSNIVRPDPEPAYEDWCKKMEVYTKSLKSLRQLAEKNFEQKVTGYARRGTISTINTSNPAPANPSPVTRISSSFSPVSRRTHQPSSHRRFICERGNDRWAKVLNQRALVKNLIKQRQAVQTRREQCNTSFAKRSSKKVKGMCNKAQQAKNDQRFMTSELKAPQQWLTQHKQSQLTSKPILPTSVPTPRRTRLLRSICDIALPTIGRRPPVLRESSVSIVEPSKPPPPTPWEQFENFRRSFFDRNRAAIDKAHHQDYYYSPTKVTFADVNPAIAAQFMDKREKLNMDQGSLLYHGTKAGNIPSILQRGFLIPYKHYTDGASIRVANGSSFGVGIYCSHDPSYSTGYSHADNPIFICAVLKSQPLKPAGQTRNSKPGRFSPCTYGNHAYGGIRICGNICVIFEESRVVPLFLLHYAKKDPSKVVKAASDLPKPEPDFPRYKKSSRNWYQEQRKQSSRPLKFVSAQTLRETLHKNYTTIRNNRAASKQQAQLA